MIIKKSFLILFALILLSSNSYSAGSDDPPVTKVKSNYTKAVDLIKFAKKYEKKGKIEKAQKRYAKAQGLLLKSNDEKPLQADTLNYLGFTTRKLVDYDGG